MSDIKVQLNAVVKEFPGRRADENVRAVDDVTLKIYDGEFFALLGPSGCGKTTTLRLIAGFEQPTSGDIFIDGVQMAGVPAYHRPVNTVFQDYALFPHMTVLQNVAFGLKMAGLDRKTAEKRAGETLELVRLPHIGKRKPRELSGGQQQRVALARALVNRPSVLLLDEPLGALDLKLRRQMQLELKAMQAELGITFIFVTHDQEEAMTMANRIAVMDGGHVLQVGRPEEIYETPRTRFVADFIGETNFLEGTLVNQNGSTGVINLEPETNVQATIGSALDITPQQPVTVAIRPERIALLPLDASLDNIPAHFSYMRGQIEDAYYIGTDTRYVVRVGDAAVTVRVQNTDFQHAMTFKDKQFVHLLWDRQNARVLVD
ncbi:MAG: ABC transporter ATP-binding protein [Chloroflexota bacterium]